MARAVLEVMPLPAEVANPLSPVEFALVWTWWCHLGERQRQLLVNLWQNASLNSSEGAANSQVGKLEVFVQMDFVSRTEPALEHLDLPPVLVDFLVSHPLEYWDDQKMPLCTASQDIRQAIRQGTISADFKCPIHNGDCNVRKILGLAPGRDLRLSLRCRLLDNAGHAVAVV